MCKTAAKQLSEKLRDNFDEMVVYKDLKKTNFFSALSLPSFMRDWLLKKFEDDEGQFDKDDLARFVKKFIPRKDDWNAIKNDIIVENKKVKFLAKVAVNIDIKTGEVAFALPDFFEVQYENRNNSNEKQGAVFR